MTITPSRRRAAAAVLATAGALLLAACGSSLDAADVAAVNGRQVVSGGATVPGDPALDASTGSGDVTGVDQGVSSTGDPGAGSAAPPPADPGSSSASDAPSGGDGAG